MNYFKKILRFAIPYKRFAVLNIICNVFYALFSTLSFLALIPVIQILFDKEKRIVEKPEWNGLMGAKDYFTGIFNYEIAERVNQDELSALMFI